MVKLKFLYDFNILLYCCMVNFIKVDIREIIRL